MRFSNIFRPRLTCGLISLILLSYFSMLAQFYTPGIISCLNATLAEFQCKPNFLLLLYQNIVCWIILSLLYWAFCKVFCSNRIPLANFLEAVAIARYPYIVLMVLLSIVRTWQPHLLMENLKATLPHPEYPAILFSIIVVLCMIWQLIAYFHALKTTSQLSGRRLWWIFVITILLGDAISIPLAILPI